MRTRTVDGADLGWERATLRVGSGGHGCLKRFACDDSRRRVNFCFDRWIRLPFAGHSLAILLLRPMIIDDRVFDERRSLVTSVAIMACFVSSRRPIAGGSEFAANSSETDEPAVLEFCCMRGIEQEKDRLVQ
jgi:hypothetical protein